MLEHAIINSKLDTEHICTCRQQLITGTNASPSNSAEEMHQRGRIGDLRITHHRCAGEWFENKQWKGWDYIGSPEFNEKYESPMETDLPGASIGISGQLTSQSIILGD